VGTFHFDRKAGDADAFRRSPELDGATLAMAAALTQQLQLGKGTRTDLLAVSLSATDYVGHRYGTEGVEMCLQLHSLDTDLGSFFKLLDRSKIDYAVVLTADHGGHDLPERQGPPSTRIDAALNAKAISAAVGQRLGLTGELISGGPAGDYYIDRSDAPRHDAIQREARRLLLEHPQVQTVLTPADLVSIPLPAGDPGQWTLEQRARASFDQHRSGDLIVMLKPDVLAIANPTSGSVATHGTPWDYDRRVPIAFWWKGISPTDRAEPVATVDIMPTLANMIGLAVPREEIDGRCLTVESYRCP
jgi:arylsulfatase A-like enzyme